MKQEAIALYKIGLVYDKVFKLKFRAKAYLKKALEMAQSMTPRTFTTEGKFINILFIDYLFIYFLCCCCSWLVSLFSCRSLFYNDKTTVIVVVGTFK